MILQALDSYYYRLKDAGHEVSPHGFTVEKIHFEALISADGKLCRFNSLQRPATRGNKFEPKLLIVPKDRDRTSGVHPFFLWDKTAYVLGADVGGKSKRLAEQFQKFKELHCSILNNIDDYGAKAFLKFINTWNPSKSTLLENWPEIAGKNIVFRLDGEIEFLHERPAIANAWINYLKCLPKGAEGICLVTGKQTAISETHPFFIRGVKDSQSSGAALVSFNATAFKSYNKEVVTIHHLVKLWPLTTLQFSIIYWLKQVDNAFKSATPQPYSGPKSQRKSKRSSQPPWAET